VALFQKSCAAVALTVDRLDVFFGLLRSVERVFKFTVELSGQELLDTVDGMIGDTLQHTPQIAQSIRNHEGLKVFLD